ncbi:lipoyl domain-containing protein [Caballeronia sp. LZ033]|uniref:lipoyl domain-containing protein n=1 Tax=Caballeronia sp. LZ033 TaxID=3038566 RepID=UPI00285655FD|nr:lipoyl domain-containing protein [Caballeronia sp. LZ033]MDR5813075.1 lipoyl domain-containing protein [Caballeronia sp. LZ033]
MDWSQTLRNIGTAFAERILVRLTRDDEPAKEPTREQLHADPQFPEVADQLRTALKQLSKKLETIAPDVARQVIDKLEQDQYELLESRIKGLIEALEFGDHSLISNRLGPIGEQAQYARNRINEGKTHWEGQWLIAENLRLAGMHAIATSEQQKAFVKLQAAELRKAILDVWGERLVKAKTDWQHIGEFIDGRGERILTEIPKLSLPRIEPSAGAQPANRMHAVIVRELNEDEQADVIQVHVNRGDRVELNQAIATLETDKTTLDVVSEAAGVILKLNVQVGDKVRNGDAIATL